MTLSDLLQRTQEWFASLGIDTARLDAEVLIAHALEIERIAFYTDGRRPLTEEEVAACRELVRRRGKREPVAYIVGSREFFSRDFAVDARVLIPRPDTETLVQLALDWLDGKPSGEVVVELDTFEEPEFVPASEPEFVPTEGEIQPGVAVEIEVDDEAPSEVEDDVEVEHEVEAAPADGRLVLDYGTGSGAIAVTLAAERAGLRVLAIDLSKEALEVAKANAGAHAVTDRVGFVASDGFERLPPRFQGQLTAIVANPPYVPLGDEPTLAPDVREHEPHQALFAGPDPLLHYRRIAQGAARWLTPDGFVALEVGAGQAQDVAALFRGWRDVTIARDLAGIQRVVAARRAR